MSMWQQQILGQYAMMNGLLGVGAAGAAAAPAPGPAPPPSSPPSAASEAPASKRMKTGALPHEQQNQEMMSHHLNQVRTLLTLSSVHVLTVHLHCRLFSLLSVPRMEAMCAQFATPHTPTRETSNSTLKSTLKMESSLLLQVQVEPLPMEKSTTLVNKTETQMKLNLINCPLQKQAVLLETATSVTFVIQPTVTLVTSNSIS